MLVPLIKNAVANFGIIFYDWDRNLFAIELEYPGLNYLDMIITNSDRKVELPFVEYLEANNLTEQNFLEVRDSKHFVLSNKNLKGYVFDTEDIEPGSFRYFKQFPKEIDNFSLKRNFSYQYTFIEETDNARHWMSVLQGVYEKDLEKNFIFVVFFCKCKNLKSETTKEKVKHLIANLKANLNCDFFIFDYERIFFIISKGWNVSSFREKLVRDFLSPLKDKSTKTQSFVM